MLQRDAVLSEPAVEVRRKGKGKQIWALEKMENRLVDMRELYQEWKDFDEDNPVGLSVQHLDTPNMHTKQAQKILHERINLFTEGASVEGIV